MVKKNDRKTVPVRVGREAVRAAKIASGYTSESVSEYIGRVVAERAGEDIERLHAEFNEGGVPEPSAC
jgi:hypothetical protein